MAGDGGRDGDKTGEGRSYRVMAGDGRPSTTSRRPQSRGWPAFAGHDTGEGAPALRNTGERALAPHSAATVHAAQRLNQGSALLALSVLL
ncbi:MAG: hypothetical protein J0H99_04755, partial [Rhodospirillales bacterium]|nr:hypothetical protein [Rhodospirillales bacterium]